MNTKKPPRCPSAVHLFRYGLARDAGIAAILPTMRLSSASTALTGFTFSSC